MKLRSDDRGLLRVVKAVVPDDGTLVLVIDQFEEVFSMVGDEVTRAAFIRSVASAVSEPDSRLRVAITLRADYFDRPLEYPGLAEAVLDGLVAVTPMGADDAARAIAGPARAAHLELEPGLVTRIVADLEGQPGPLPLLQYALTEMFERRTSDELTLDGYEAIGGVTGALGARAEAVLRSLREPARVAAHQCFLRLVTVGEHTDDLRRRVRRSELAALGVDQQALADALQAFGAARLLSFDHDPNTRGPTVEVAHEALLREWHTLRAWIGSTRRRHRSPPGAGRRGGAVV